MPRAMVPGARSDSRSTLGRSPMRRCRGRSTKAQPVRVQKKRPDASIRGDALGSRATEVPLRSPSMCSVRVHCGCRTRSRAISGQYGITIISKNNKGISLWWGTAPRPGRAGKPRRNKQCELPECCAIGSCCLNQPRHFQGCQCGRRWDMMSRHMMHHRNMSDRDRASRPGVDIRSGRWSWIDHVDSSAGMVLRCRSIA